MSIRKLPGQEERVETGPVQFGEDWPGLFIRGDTCFHFYNMLQNFFPPMDALAAQAHKGLTALLKSPLLHINVETPNLSTNNKEGKGT